MIAPYACCVQSLLYDLFLLVPTELAKAHSLPLLLFSGKHPNMDRTLSFKLLGPHVS